ncbi:hypothetical protein F2Q68_00003503 [Brassica cretica]|uniref:Uncharacterized protein n=1 Tax=Brassica cretica TaxID=69181 RepID=A0A3N6QZF4_BRACR|nr:hypothetical protein F2Q68_00003503 [Brassica cretica]
MPWISLRDLTESTGVLGFSGAPARSNELWIRDPSLAGIVRRVAANAVLASPSRSNRLLPQLVSREPLSIGREPTPWRASAIVVASLLAG